MSYIDVVKHKKPVGKRVAVIGGGAIGFDISEYLAHEGESTSQNIDAWLQEWGIDKTLKARAGIEDIKQIFIHHQEKFLCLNEVKESLEVS